MGVIFTGGFGIGTVPNDNNQIFWDGNYTSPGLTIYPDVTGATFGGPMTFYRSSITDNDPGVFSALGKTAINYGDKRIVTYTIDQDYEGYSPNYWLGFGARGMDLNGPLGAENNLLSFGITDEGNVYGNNSTIASGLTAFGTIGDIIDVVIHAGYYLWYRVNGGLWNNDITADPSTGTLGIDISSYSGSTFYPAISILGQTGPSMFSVYQSSPFGVPSGFTQIAGDRTVGSFTLTSESFDTNYSYGSVCGGASTGEWAPNLSGFTVSTSQNNTYCGVYGYLSGNTINQIQNAFTSVSATADWNGYIFDVVWGPGSSITNGVVKLAFIPNNSNLIDIIPLDPSDPTNFNNDNNASTGTSLAGTFNLPATFTFRLPLDKKGGWC